MEDTLNRNTNTFPDIYFNFDYNQNPMISSPNCEYAIFFKQTKETLIEIDTYKNFIENAVSNFRHSRLYKQYKSYLIDLGLDRCQYFPNIDVDAVGVKGIEMHHNFLTIYDIALMICEHILNTVGSITSFELIHLLKEEHKENRIPIVMLSKSVHQMYHNNEDFVIPAKQCFGFWMELLYKYNKGITINIANKIITFLQKSIESEKIEDKNQYNYVNSLLKLRDDIYNWSIYNQYGNQPQIGEIVY